MRPPAVPSRVPPALDKHDLYELCVQSPRHAVPLLRAIHAGGGRVLGEDFAGTGALSREWCRTVPGGRAIAIDLDESVLERCRAKWQAEGGDAGAITTIAADLLAPRDDLSNLKADVIFTGNFSIGEIHDRPALIAYLKRTLQRLTEGGAFICDTYGGESAFLTGSVERTHTPPSPLHAAPAARHARPQQIVYTWEQRDADPLTGRVTDVLHFRLFEGKDIVADFPDAFIYNWRLWSVPELRDAMLEAGFARTAVYAQLPDAVDDDGEAYIRPIEDPAEELDDSFNVYIAAFGPNSADSR